MADIGDPVIRDELSALSWVHDELRRSLDAAHKALRRYLKESEQAGDLDRVDPAVLRQARSQLHQSVGVLELVGLGPAAALLHAAEAAVQRLSARPRLITLSAVETIERGSFALLDFIGRRLAGKAISPLALFPQYRALQELAAASRIHPADLWPVDFEWRALPPDAGAAPLHPDASIIGQIESNMLSMMRGAPPSVAAQMSEVFAGLAAGALESAPAAGHQRRLATLWQLAAAFFEALANGLLQPDVYNKRVGSKLLAQLHAGEAAEPSQRLAHDLLFFCSQAAPRQGVPLLGTGGTARLATVRQGYGLADAQPVDFEVTRLGRHDPAWVSQARKRIGAAKEVWSAVAGGELARLPGLSEQFALVADSLQRLYPDGGTLGRALQVAVAQTVASSAEPPAAMAMEVATALLYLDASLDDGDFDHPELVTRIQRLAQRIEQVRQQRDPGTLELWMEDLYRRVSDRQTMGSVVAELRSSLSEIEKHIDQYFRDPTQRDVLFPVPAQLSSMRGVLSVLGLDQASQAVLCMRDDVDRLAATEVDPARAVAAGSFDRLADNLGALSFLIDMVSVQPQMAKSLFRFDPDSGLLSAVMAREERPTGFEELDTRPTEDAAKDAPRDTDALAVTLEFDRMVKQARAGHRGGAVESGQPAQPLMQLQLPDDAVADATPPSAPAEAEPAPPIAAADDELQPPPAAAAPEPSPVEPPPALPPSVAAPTMPVAAPQRSGLEDDPEMREVFLEEAREVLQAAREGLQALQFRHDDQEAMTGVRRALHTLKGSSRMVGLTEFGEAAWACEQLYNARLAEHQGCDADLREFSLEACAYFERWIDAIAAGDASAFHPEVVARPADSLRIERRRVRLGATPAAEPAAAPPRPAPLQQRLPDLPSASDLDLVAASKLPPPGVEFPGLDLAALDDVEPATAPATEEQAIAVPETVEFDLPPEAGPAVEPEPRPDIDAGAAQPEPPAVQPAEDAVLPPVAPDAESYKQIGPLRIGIPLFNIYLNEADELSRRLGVELAEWSLEQHRPVDRTAVALAHSLAGNSATVGFADLSQLARALEHALGRSQSRGSRRDDEAALFVRGADEIRRLLHQFAAGFLSRPDADLVQRLQGIANAPPSEDELLTGTPLPLDFAEEEDEFESLTDEEFAPTSLPDEAEVAAPVEAADELAAPDSAEPPLTAPGVLGELGRAALLPFEPLPEAPSQRPAPAETASIDDEIDAVDAIDAELFPIFEEEATELLVQLHGRLRDWSSRPAAQAVAASACMRTLHTFKGGARLAGAMRLGEMAHRLETAVERLTASGTEGSPADIDDLVARADALEAHFEALRGTAKLPAMPPAALAAAPESRPASAVAAPAPPAAERPSVAQSPAPIDWQRFSALPVEAGAAPVSSSALVPAPRPAAPGSASVRVSGPLLDRLVNQAGEVSIARARITGDVRQFMHSLVDLSDNLDRLRSQLRDLELLAETQIGTRVEAARISQQQFDPLEMDRFTRFQELSRMIAESVGDVATVQRGLHRTLQSTEDALAHQARMTRDMQDDLLRTRMVQFEGLSERLYRVVRQAAKETGKPVRLDIVGGSIEVDRGVLDRIMPAVEHLLRNSVVHGIEWAQERANAGKDPTGTITLAVTQAGNEVALEVRDDGGGLHLDRIRDRGRSLGLIAADAEPDAAELANLIFQPGFTTATGVTDLAGRGVGMDVVRTEVIAMGGRIETASAPGQGTSFRLVLPLTTAVTQVVMLRCGERAVAVPSTLVETIKLISADELAAAYARGSVRHGDRELPFFWLDALLQGSARGHASGRNAHVAVIRSADQRIVLHIDEVQGNQEAVVKNLGPQLARLPGLVGMTLLPSGIPALIYNPVALATLYGEQARTASPAAERRAERLGEAAVEPLAPLVLVVDDSLTVRRITERLLEREGYRVMLAKDGLDGLEKLAGELPAVVLTDIEMPRMDGFDLVRNMRVDARLAELPVIMITSRIAPKHRAYAAELGVDHYLGKPYVEDELLGMIARYARRAVAA